ncbi:MAG: pilin [Patescibacteria group bacterium]|jgi:hypothetical protein
MFKKAFGFTVLLRLLKPSTVLAQEEWGSRCVVRGTATIQGLECLFLNVLQSIVSLVGIVFFIILLVSGFQYLFSGNDPKKTAQATSTITMAILGVAGIIASWLILRIISRFTGVNVLEFTIPGFNNGFHLN